MSLKDLVKDAGLDAVGLAGLGLFWYGLSLWSLPAAFTATGAVLLLLAVIGALRG